jgi:subtilisin family serine protease
MKEIVDRLDEAGIATVVASGNHSEENGMGSPACISSTISVGAADESSDVAEFSNSAPGLDFLAPGVAIRSSSGRIRHL